MTRRAVALVSLAHLGATCWIFGGVLGGRLLYFRDLSTQYAPWYAFASQELRRGVWPLWNPTANAGEPFLLAYPPDLLLLLVGGWTVPLGIGAALHLLMALGGMTWLASRMGMGPWAAWMAGAVYGLGGVTLSLVNLMPLFQAAAWAPWVIGSFLVAAERGSARRVAVFAAVLALQVSTLGVEIVLQTGLIAATLALHPPLPPAARRCLHTGVLGTLLAVCLSAPAIAGVHALLAGTPRSRGWPVAEALTFSVHPVALMEAILPRWLGSPHAFTDADFWGAAYFPEGYPYLGTLYVGIPVLLLAAQASSHRRLWGLALIGMLLALGSNGPLGLVPAHATFPLRGPQKLMFLTQLSFALLTGLGMDRRFREPPSPSARRFMLLAGVGALSLVALVIVAPDASRAFLARLVPELGSARAAVAAHTTWPRTWLPSAVFTLGAALALARGRRLLPLAASAVVLDLVIVNGAVNPLAPSSFYRLRADVADLLRPICDSTQGRVFSFGIAQTPGLSFEPVMAYVPSDVWLYYLDRQTLLPLTPSLDGFDGAFDGDRTGWSPPGATLTAREGVPQRFSGFVERFRRAGVKWVLSFRELSAELTTERGRLKMPEIRDPLHLYEVRGALPRAYFVPTGEVLPDSRRRLDRLRDAAFDPHRLVLLDEQTPQPSTSKTDPGVKGVVSYERVDAHTVRVRARTPPGFIVVLDGFHPDWTAEQDGQPVPLFQANDRYRAVPTGGGEHLFTLYFRPKWRLPALLICAAALLLTSTLLFRPEGGSAAKGRWRVAPRFRGKLEIGGGSRQPAC